MNQIIVENNDTWLLIGELSLSTINSILAEFAQLRTHVTAPTVIDLREVTRSDSAGLALLIELLKQTQPHPIKFRHLPAQLHSLAQVCGVVELLPILTA